LGQVAQLGKGLSNFKKVEANSLVKEGCETKLPNWGRVIGAMLLPKKIIEEIISSTCNLDIKLLFFKILPTITLCEMIQILLKDYKMNEKMWSFAWKVTPWVKS
jgi:hypothetical protein